MKKTISTILLTLTIFSTFALVPTVTHAQNDFVARPIPKPNTLPGPTLNQGDQETPEVNNFVTDILPRFAIGLIGFVGTATLIMIVVAGIRLSTMSGNDEAVEKAKQQLIYSITGFVVAILAYTIVSIIVNLDFFEQDNTNRSALDSTPADDPGLTGEGGLDEAGISQDELDEAAQEAREEAETELENEN